MGTNIFHAGKYYVGDLCYAVSDKAWNQLMDETGCFGLDNSAIIDIEKFDDGIFYYHGERCFIMSTAHGDGTYVDEKRRKYFVDSGSLGIMPISVCDGNSMSGGHIIDFKNDFEVYEAGSIFCFGDFHISTGGYY